MKYVGGYQSHELLLQDARAYGDVLIAMAGEADARRQAELEAKAGR